MRPVLVFPPPRLGLQVRHETQPSEGAVHQRPYPVVAGAVTYRGCGAFQGRGRGLTDTFRSYNPVPAGAAQRSLIDPAAAAEGIAVFPDATNRFRLLSFV